MSADGFNPSSPWPGGGHKKAPPVPVLAGFADYMPTHTRAEGAGHFALSLQLIDRLLKQTKVRHKAGVKSGKPRTTPLPLEPGLLPNELLRIAARAFKK